MNASLEQWKKRTGLDPADAVPLGEDDHRRLLPDGSIIQRGHFQTEVVPPPDGWAGLELRLKFWQIRQAQAEEAFFRLKEALLRPDRAPAFDCARHWPVGMGSPSGDAVADLEFFKEMAGFFRQRVAFYSGVLAESDDAKRKEARSEAAKLAAETAAQRQYELAKKVSTITLEN